MISQAFPYSPPNAPETDSILEALATILRNIIAPIQFNGSPILKTVQVSGTKEYVSLLPLATVTFNAGPSKRKDFGGVTENEVHAMLTFFGDYRVQDIAEKWITRMYDLLTLYFSENSTLVDGLPPNQIADTSVYPFGVSEVRLNENFPKSFYITQGVPVPLRVLELEVIAFQRFVSPFGIKRWPPQ